MSFLFDLNDLLVHPNGLLILSATPTPAPRLANTHDAFTFSISKSSVLLCRKVRFYKKHPKSEDFGRFLEGTVIIDILDGRDCCRRTAKRPFWAAARVRRTSVFTAGETLGAGAALPPRAWKSRRVERAHSPRNPKRKKRPVGHVFLFGAASQIRTGDLVLTKDALYLLSYSSKKWRPGTGSNRRPLA